jgi:hypothetical protein
MLDSTKCGIGHPIAAIAEAVGATYRSPSAAIRSKLGFAATANSLEHLAVPIGLYSEFGFWVSAGAVAVAHPRQEQRLSGRSLDQIA